MYQLYPVWSDIASTFWMAKKFEWLLKFPLDSIRISSAESTPCKHLSIYPLARPARTDHWLLINDLDLARTRRPRQKIITYACSKSRGKLHFEPEANSACLHVRGNNIVRSHLDTFSNSRVTFRNSTFKCLESFEWRMQFHFMGNEVGPIWAKPKRLATLCLCASQAWACIIMLWRKCWNMCFIWFHLASFHYHFFPYGSQLNPTK